MLFFGDSHSGRLRNSWLRSQRIPQESCSPPEAIRGGRRAFSAGTLAEALASGTQWHGACCPVILWLGVNDLRIGDSLLPPMPAAVAAAVAGAAMALQSLLRGARIVIIGAPYALRASGLMRRRVDDFNSALEATAAVPGWLFVNPTVEVGGVRPMYARDGLHLAAPFLEAILKVKYMINLHGPSISSKFEYLGCYPSKIVQFLY